MVRGRVGITKYSVAGNIFEVKDCASLCSCEMR